MDITFSLSRIAIVETFKRKPANKAKLLVGNINSSRAHTLTHRIENSCLVFIMLESVAPLQGHSSSGTGHAQSGFC